MRKLNSLEFVIVHFLCSSVVSGGNRESRSGKMCEL